MTAPVPYIFELSAWRDDKQEIVDWLVDQLKFDCGIDPKVGYQWIKHNRLVPLLDGLDELGLERQKKCVPKINEFAKLPSQQLVVCCRSEEYAEGEAVLDELRGALCLQPLTKSQIKQYLIQSDRKQVWRAMQQEPELTKLLEVSEVTTADGKKETPFLQIPLFLQMLAVAYKTKSPNPSARLICLMHT